MKKITQELIKETNKCMKSDDIPVAALIVENNKIISRGHNIREKQHKITGHAEIEAIEKACKKKKSWHLINCELYVTLEPCPMCIEIIKQARIKKIHYLISQEKIKKQQQIIKEKIEDEKSVEKYRNILTTFFKKLRNKNK